MAVRFLVLLVASAGAALNKTNVVVPVANQTVIKKVDAVEAKGFVNQSLVAAAPPQIPVAGGGYSYLSFYLTMLDIYSNIGIAWGFIEIGGLMIGKGKAAGKSDLEIVEHKHASFLEEEAVVERDPDACFLELEGDLAPEPLFALEMVEVESETPKHHAPKQQNLLQKQKEYMQKQQMAMKKKGMEMKKGWEKAKHDAQHKAENYHQTMVAAFEKNRKAAEAKRKAFQNWLVHPAWKKATDKMAKSNALEKSAPPAQGSVTPMSKARMRTYFFLTLMNRVSAFRQAMATKDIMASGPFGGWISFLGILLHQVNMNRVVQVDKWLDYAVPKEQLIQGKMQLKAKSFEKMHAVKVLIYMAHRGMHCAYYSMLQSSFLGLWISYLSIWGGGGMKAILGMWINLDMMRLAYLMIMEAKIAYRVDAGETGLACEAGKVLTWAGWTYAHLNLLTIWSLYYPSAAAAPPAQSMSYYSYAPVYTPSYGYPYYYSPFPQRQQ